MFVFGAIVGVVLTLVAVVLVARYKPKWLAKLIKESGEELDDFERHIGGND